MATIPLGDGFTGFMVPDRLQGALLLALADPAGDLNLPKLQVAGPSGNNQLPSILAVDLNGDSKPDVVLGDGNGVLVELNQGSGGFASPVPYLAGTPVTGAAAGDVNNDGKLDLVFATANGVAVLLGKGDGTLGLPLAVPGAKALSIVLAEFNKDGRQDIAGIDSNGNLSLSFGNGDGTFKPAMQVTLAGTGLPGSIVTGDFNGDGKPDLIAGFAGLDVKGNNIFFLPGNGDGAFAAPQRIPVPDSFSPNVTFSSADLNGDGKPDLALIFQTPDVDQIATYFGKGDGTFQPPAFVTLKNIPTTLTLADLDGDGKADLLIGSCCGLAEPTYLLGHGDGTFQPEQYFVTGPGPVSFAVAGSLIAAAGYESLSKVATLALLTYRSAAAAAPLTVVSTANPSAGAVAPGSLAAAFGTSLSSSVAIRDSIGVTANASVQFSSPSQVNFLVPSTVALGTATVLIGNSTAQVRIASVAPGLFTLNGDGLAAANAILISGGDQTPESVFSVSGTSVVANPISLGGTGDYVVLILFGTGLRGAGTAGTTVTIGGVNATVQYAGAQGGFEGLDQVNVITPASLAGKGSVTVQLTAAGISANPATITIR